MIGYQIRPTRNYKGREDAYMVSCQQLFLWDVRGSCAERELLQISEEFVAFMERLQPVLLKRGTVRVVSNMLRVDVLQETLGCPARRKSASWGLVSTRTLVSN